MATQPNKTTKGLIPGVIPAFSAENTNAAPSTKEMTKPNAIPALF